MDLENDLARYLANDLDGDGGRVSHPLGGIGGVGKGELDEKKLQRDC